MESKCCSQNLPISNFLERTNRPVHEIFYLLHIRVAKAWARLYSLSRAFPAGTPDICLCSQGPKFPMECRCLFPNFEKKIPILKKKFFFFFWKVGIFIQSTHKLHGDILLKFNGNRITQVNRMSRSRRMLAIGGKHCDCGWTGSVFIHFYFL